VDAIQVEAVTPATATFTERGHIYRDGDQVVPSVSQVLELAGIDDLRGVPRFNVKRAAARGQAVHTATQFLDLKKLDQHSVSPEIAGYVMGYEQFKRDTGFHPIAIEERGIGQISGMKFGYCIDRVGILFDRLAIVDLKTASKAFDWWAIQTAGYAEGIKHDGPRYSVHLAGDGKYKLIPYEDAGDGEIWLAALNVAHWKLAHGWKLPR
jgi:hypothetical protein